ncbi:hypothetical protein P3T22_001553 [Paraburkholderia sp. GAS348]
MCCSFSPSSSVMIFRIWYFWIFPVTVVGNESTKRIYLGTLRSCKPVFRAMGLSDGSFAEKNDRSRFFAARDGFCTCSSPFPGVFRHVQPHGEIEDQRVGTGHAAA